MKNIHELDKEIALVDLRHKKDSASLEKALELQAVEYKRRLEILNGEAQHLQDIQATYLPREVWENTMVELKKEIEELKQYKNTNLGRQSITAIIIPAVVSLIFLVINFFLNRVQ